MSDSQFSFEFNAAVPERKIYGVRELVGAVRGQLEKSFPDLWVEGEISNCRPAESGHVYLTLKDGDAQLRVVMYRSQSRLLRFKPQNGLAVLVRGRITLYEARGEMQLVAEHMEPLGAGALQLAFEQLKQKLAAEGLFDSARKKPLPALPRRIGVVTSPRGAVIRDILNVLRRRHNTLSVLIYPAQVQGDSAAAEVAEGVRFFNEQAAGEEFSVDVIVLARGGGSLEDLAAFNDESLARTVAASRLPTISAIGHETDFTICDFVADLRAPTPSAAAELVIGSRQEIEESLEALRDRLRRAMQYKLLYQRQQLGALAKNRAFARMEDAIALRQQRIDDLSFRLESQLRARLSAAQRKLELAASHLYRQDVRRRLVMRQKDLEARVEALTSTLQKAMMRRRARLEQAAAQLAVLSPVSILARGYSLIFDASGHLVKDAAQLHPGDEIRARLARGEVEAQVRATHSEAAPPGVAHSAGDTNSSGGVAETTRKAGKRKPGN
ncbi:MAG: exodeoxyribonuclease VII large subunit [Acidobacteriota bacterium]|nr:exodeoxyribonuclease VII large subunit [Acidobacteriota bacterium]